MLQFQGGNIMSILFFVATGMLTVWGISHLVVTKSVVKGFGDLSLDNKRIITMEWIIEGVTLVFLGVIIGLVTIIDRNSHVSLGVYWLSVIMLNVLSVISLFTGFKIKFLPFKLCPIIFTGSSILIILGLSGL
ncbi:MAG: hypothetical protein QG657_4849 [Acidobacteriota bacterium]|nr:hypothetical protein [Acidobacteriota bacterium]